MGLESGNLIVQLQEGNPLNTDDVNQGDDHLRLIKNVLKNNFPGKGGQGFDKQILSNEDELNYSQGLTSNIQDQLTALSGGESSISVRVTQNETDIASNVANISNNAANININASNISINASAIGSQNGKINTNTSNISSNASGISSNSSRITGNTNNISSNSSRITSLENQPVQNDIISGVFNGSTLQVLGGSGFSVSRISGQPAGSYVINFNRSLGSYYSISGSSSGGHVLTQYSSSTKAHLVTSTLDNLTVPANATEIHFIARAN